MQTIHKFPLGTNNNQPVHINMPEGAHVIHMDWDPNTNQICLWAVVLDDNKGSMESRTFYIAGTGQDLNRGLKGDEVMDHFSTFKVLGPAMTGWFHGFEVREPDYDVRVD